jgi:hypothetical protein
LRDIHHKLRQDGIEMAYSTLCWAVGTLRHSQPAAGPAERRLDLPAAPGRPGETTVEVAGRDPLRNLRRLSERRPGFEYSGTLPDEELFGRKSAKPRREVYGELAER